MKNLIAVLLLAALIALPLAAHAGPLTDQLGNFKARIDLVKNDVTALQSSGLAVMKPFLYGKVLFHLNYASNLMAQAVALSGGNGFAGPLGKALAEFERARLIIDEQYEKGAFTFAQMQGEVRILRNLLGMIKLAQEMARTGR